MRTIKDATPTEKMELEELRNQLTSEGALPSSADKADEECITNALFYAMCYGYTWGRADFG